MSVLLWLQLSFAMLLAEIHAIGIAIYPWLLVADIYNVYRASQDARDSDVRNAVKQQRRNTGDALRA